MKQGIDKEQLETQRQEMNYFRKKLNENKIVLSKGLVTRFNRCTQVNQKFFDSNEFILNEINSELIKKHIIKNSLVLNIAAIGITRLPVQQLKCNKNFLFYITEINCENNLLNCIPNLFEIFENLKILKCNGNYLTFFNHQIKAKLSTDWQSHTLENQKTLSQRFVEGNNQVCLSTNVIPNEEIAVHSNANENRHTENNTNYDVNMNVQNMHIEKKPTINDMIKKMDMGIPFDITAEKKPCIEGELLDAGLVDELTFILSKVNVETINDNVSFLLNKSPFSLVSWVGGNASIVSTNNQVNMNIPFTTCAEDTSDKIIENKKQKRINVY